MFVKTKVKQCLAYDGYLFLKSFCFTKHTVIEATSYSQNSDRYFKNISFIHLKDRTTERESKRERENENLPFAGLLSKWPQ